MLKWFGTVHYVAPYNFLRSRGYTMTSEHFNFIPPTHSHSVNSEEAQCLMHLRINWDFGGLVNWKYENKVIADTKIGLEGEQ